MKKYAILGVLAACALLVGGCTALAAQHSVVQYPVIGSFLQHNEVFKGTVDSDLATGTSRIWMAGVVV